MKQGILEELAKETGLMISDFHDHKNYQIMYDFLKEIPAGTYTLFDYTIAVKYALKESELESESIDALLAYFKTKI